MKIRNKAVPAVYILLEKEDKILLGKRSNTGYQEDIDINVFCIQKEQARHL